VSSIKPFKSLTAVNCDTRLASQIVIPTVALLQTELA